MSKEMESTMSVEAMFAAMMQSVGVTNTSDVSAEVITNVIDEVDSYAVSKGYHYDESKDVYFDGQTSDGALNLSAIR